jgi:archaellum component FlaC
MDNSITWEAIDKRIHEVIDDKPLASQSQVDDHEQRIRINEQSIQAILESIQGVHSTVNELSNRFSNVETIVNMNAQIHNAWKDQMQMVSSELASLRDNIADDYRATREEALVAVTSVHDLKVRLSEETARSRRRQELQEYILSFYADDLAWARNQRAYQEAAWAFVDTRVGKLAAGATVIGLLLAADVLTETFGITDLLDTIFGGIFP